MNSLLDFSFSVCSKMLSSIEKLVCSAMQLNVNFISLFCVICRFGFGYGFGAAKGAKLLTNTMPGFSDAHDKKPNPMQQLQQSLQRMLPKQTAGSSKR